MKHKPIPKQIREQVFWKYSGHCAYCGCELEYKDMQVDHIESVYVSDLRGRPQNDDISNLMPACRAERGGHYWYVDYDGTATEIYESFDYFDEKRYSIGNYFRTFEDAEDMAVKFRALLVKAMMKGE